MGKVSLGVVLCLGLWSAPAWALNVQVLSSAPSVVGEAYTFEAMAEVASGAVKYEWKFSESEDFQEGAAKTAHTYAVAGHYSVDVRVTDGAGDSAVISFQHLVHYPLAPRRPTSATSIVYDQARGRVYSVNQDNDTVTAIDAVTLTKLGELAVYRGPQSLALTPSGKLWVVHQDDYAVAVVNPNDFSIERGFRLPYASQPMGVVMSPSGDAAYISLMALGKLLKLNPETGELLGEVSVGPWPRGISVSADGRVVFVTRFISGDSGGEVIQVDSTAMKVASRIVLATDTTTRDSDQAARGVPNYLFSVGISPDGRQAWVAAKKDNVLRGQLRDGLKLTHETTVRPLVSVLDLGTAQELLGARIDLDDRSLPTHVEFSPFGDFAIISLFGSNRVEVRDAFNTTAVFSAIGDVGAGPRASVVSADGRLFVQASLTRNVLVYDMSALFEAFDKGTPFLLKDIPAVANDKLAADVLLGKQIFHSSADIRMTSQGYLSCAACHFEGLDDGRVWDFASRGEGLRNTPALLGRRGAGQGRMNWSANEDEIQDMEGLIRELFVGRGFVANDLLAVGTRKDPLGDPKAGLSKELDALSAYVSSLDHVKPSPYRNPDGSLTLDGAAGESIFRRLGCDFCHGGSTFTDSARALLHDVGTLTPNSGKRLGAALTGLDTPTLLGVWETAPYLHDGSASTLRDVLTTKNTTDLHGFVGALSAAQLDQLVAYLQQIDDEEPIARLPFDPPAPSGGTPSNGGSSGAAGGFAATAGTSGSSGLSSGSGGQTQAGAGAAVADERGCNASRNRPIGMASVGLTVLAAVAALGRRRSKRQRAARPR